MSIMARVYRLPPAPPHKKTIGQASHAVRATKGRVQAATKVMDGYVEFTQAHADVPWRSMRNMRNRMAHGYFDINLDVVWETVQEWLPALLQQLPAVRQDADDEDRNDKGMEP